MPAELNLVAADEAAMVALGQRLGEATQGRAVLFLRGDLGAGKTTLSRGILRAFGHAGAVKSPTYTLVEPYELGDWRIFHFDLYRLGDPEELEYLGIRDYFDGNSLCLVEWPERGNAVLAAPDVDVTIRTLNAGRELQLIARTDHGQEILRRLTDTEE